MTWYESVLLGFLQGATEFLPVSSSGHLVMGQAFLGVEQPGIGLEIVLHVATLASVLTVYRARIGALAAGVARGDRDHVRYAGLLVLASVPAGVAGVAFGGFFESLFDSLLLTGAALVFTGCVLWTARRALARSPSASPDAGAALTMGLAQVLAIVPGVSRSGTTVVAGLWRGVAPAEAAAFSFLMSVPAVSGAALLKLPDAVDAGFSASSSTWIAAAVACGTGVVAIRTFHAVLERRAFHRFAPYLWAAGAALLWYAGRS